MSKSEVLAEKIRTLRQQAEELRRLWETADIMRGVRLHEAENEVAAGVVVYNTRYRAAEDILSAVEHVLSAAHAFSVGAWDLRPLKAGALEELLLEEASAVLEAVEVLVGFVRRWARLTDAARNAIVTSVWGEHGS